MKVAIHEEMIKNVFRVITSRSLHFQAVSVLSFLVHCCPSILLFSLAVSSTYEEIDGKNVMHRKFTLGMVFPVTKETFNEITCYKINSNYV